MAEVLTTALDQKNASVRIGTDFESVMPRDERGRWVRLPRTSARPLLGTKSPDFSKQQSPRSILIEGFVGSNGHRLVTNFFVFHFLKTLLVSKIRNLLIKSKLIFVYRRTQQATVDTILGLKTKIVPTS